MSPSNSIPNDSLFEDEDYEHIYDAYSEESIQKTLEGLMYFVATSKQDTAPISLTNAYDFLFFLKKHFKYRVKKE
jgi:hypothetical protein